MEFKTRNVKFHLKKYDRDIWNFPTQGCGRIAFYTIFWDWSYITNITNISWTVLKIIYIVKEIMLGMLIGY